MYFLIIQFNKKYINLLSLYNLVKYYIIIIIQFIEILHHYFKKCHINVIFFIHVLIYTVDILLYSLICGVYL